MTTSTTVPPSLAISALNGSIIAMTNGFCCARIVTFFSFKTCHHLGASGPPLRALGLEAIDQPLGVTVGDAVGRSRHHLHLVGGEDQRLRRQRVGLPQNPPTSSTLLTSSSLRVAVTLVVGAGLGVLDVEMQLPAAEDAAGIIDRLDDEIGRLLHVGAVGAGRAGERQHHADRDFAGPCAKDGLADQARERRAQSCRRRDADGSERSNLPSLISCS